MGIELQRAVMSELPAIQRMGSYYVYDMSEYVGSQPGWEFPDTGEYQCRSLKPYFEDEKAHPFTIRVDGELAGFAIVDDKGSSVDTKHNMAQFFVHRKFKGQGVGRTAAHHCFRQYRGAWEIIIIPENTGALLFWKRAVGSFTNGAFFETQSNVAHLEGSLQNILSFVS